MPYIKLKDFKGTNTEQENIPPNVLPFSLNTDTSKGRLAKRGGYVSLLDLETTGSPKGLHTAKLSSGDALFLGADTSAYKLSGTEDTEVVDTIALFAEGTFNDSMIKKSIVDNLTDSGGVSTDFTLIGQEIDVTSISNLERILVYIQPKATTTATLTVYTTIAKTTTVGSATLVLASTAKTLCSFIFSTKLDVSAIISAYFEISLFGTVHDAVNFGGSYAGGKGWYDGVNIGTTDLRFALYEDVAGVQTTSVADGSDGEYISKIFDLGQTPISNVLTFSVTTPANTGILMYASGSDDGVRFGDYGVVASGGSINLNRYIKIKAFLYITSGGVSPSLDDFTITFTTSFDTKTEFDTSLTGNKIRWVNVEGLQDDGAGGLEYAKYVYYCDGGLPRKYDGTTVTDILTAVDSDVMYYHKNYMFYVPSANPATLYFSDVYGTTLTDPLIDLEVISATSYKQFPSAIKGLRTFEGKLVVTGNDFTAFVTGDIFGSANDNTSVYIIDDIGAVNHESMSVCTTPSGTILVMVTKDGIRYLSGSTYENALQQTPLSDTVRTYIKGGNFDNAYTKYSDGKLYVGFNSGVIPTDYIDSMLVFDFTNGMTIDGIWDIALNDMAEFNGKLYGSSSDTTNVFELFSGESDNGSDISMIAIMRMSMEEYEATLNRLNIKATTDSDFTNPTTCQIIVSADNHSRTLDLKESTWRESTSHYSQYKGQDLMESKRSIKKRGTFVELNVIVTSSYKCEFDSFEIEYGGVR